MSPSNARLGVMGGRGRPHEGAAAQETRGWEETLASCLEAATHKLDWAGGLGFSHWLSRKEHFWLPATFLRGPSPGPSARPLPADPTVAPHPPLRVAGASLCACHTPGEKVSGSSQPSPVAPKAEGCLQVPETSLEPVSGTRLRPLSLEGCARGGGSGSQNEQAGGWRGDTPAPPGGQHPAPRPSSARPHGGLGVPHPGPVSTVPLQAPGPAPAGLSRPSVPSQGRRCWFLAHCPLPQGEPPWASLDGRSLGLFR